MSFDINTIIFVGFLIANLVLGLRSSRGIKNITEYAIGNRNFSTATIVATIVATWVTGTFFFTIASESYNDGLYFIWIITSDLVYFLLVGIVFAPRMGEFLGKLSIAEAMGSIYGDKVRVITAIAGFLGITGYISVQLKVAGMAFEYALGIPSSHGSIIAGLLITTYSSLGGIKSVTFTDVIQFITFGIVIPVVAYFLLNSLSSIEVLTNVISTNPLFNYKEVFDFSQSKSLYFLFLFLIYAIPEIDSAVFQRISMAKNTSQVSKSFVISAFTCLLLGLIVCWIGVLTLAIHPNINPSDVIKTILDDYAHIMGLKALILAGVMAMIMSTVDSYINSTSVLVVHDFFKPLKFKAFYNELFSARIVSVIIGVISIMLSLRQGSLLKLTISTRALYMPIVTVPFIMTILGFRSTTKSVILGMIAGFTTVLIWHYFNITLVDDVVPAMFANLVVLISSHYLLKQPGGWVGIKDLGPLQYMRTHRKLKFRKFLQAIKNFNFIDACYKNSPKGEGLTSILGVFVMITSFSSLNFMQEGLRHQYSYLLDIIYPITLCSASALMSYPLWLQQWKETKAIGIIWNAIAFFVLICFSCLIVFISHFSEVALIALLVNILIISSLVSWKWALSTIATGMTLVTFCYSHYITDTHNILSSEFKIAYLLLSISGALVLFLKPKQQLYESTEQKVSQLQDIVCDRDVELTKSLELKNEFIRNINHEVHAPVTGIASLGKTLWESYDKFTEPQRRNAVEVIAKSADRLISLTNNMIDLSKLSSLKYDLNIQKTNLTELVIDRINVCKKLYLGNKELEFSFKVKDDVVANCDKYYISQTLDNLIINAINYSGKHGTISVSLTVIGDSIECAITDEGIGIPHEELYDIFGAFVVSSKTKTPAGGRGIGLALCKNVIEHHGGRIWAESELEQGATFTFVIPTHFKR